MMCMKCFRHMHADSGTAIICSGNQASGKRKAKGEVDLHPVCSWEEATHPPKSNPAVSLLHPINATMAILSGLSGLAQTRDLGSKSNHQRLPY